mgnify:CR=1 FL=1
MIDEKIDKTKIDVVDITDSGDVTYWRTKSTAERLNAIEFMRRVMFGHDRVSQRLQRVLTIIDPKKD